MKTKKILATLLSLAMIVGCMPVMVWADEAEDIIEEPAEQEIEETVPEESEDDEEEQDSEQETEETCEPDTYDETVSEVTFFERSWNGTKVVATERTEGNVPSVPSDGSMTSGWYCLDRNVTVNGRINLTGDTYIILCDGLKLDVKGIYVPKGSTLTIYGQEYNTGYIYSHPSTGAGIGAKSDNHPGGNIVIHGGKIKSEGADHCAGIGGNDDNQKDIGDFTMYGGDVTAIGGESGAGIGGGRACEGGKITIYGGTVTAEGGHYGAGIGGGNGQDTNPLRGAHAGTITIYGGTVTAEGGDDAAGIGGGEGGNAGKITINGGTITANGGHNGAGIGCGEAESTGNGGTVTINGGVVNAYGGGEGASIGGGSDGHCSQITINGGNVTADNDDHENAAAIGGGCDADGGNITINGGTVYAYSRDGAGIGGGENGDGGIILITGGEVHAEHRGEGNGARIGGGNHSGEGGIITITGGTVFATGYHGAGIGGGRADDGTDHVSGDGGEITITGGTVNAYSTYGFAIGAGGQQGDIAEYFEDGDRLFIGDAGTITIGGDAVVNAYGRPAGIGGDAGKILIKDNCTVLATGSEEEEYGNGIVLTAETASGSDAVRLEIAGGNVTAAGIGGGSGISLAGTWSGAHYDEFNKIIYTGGIVTITSSERAVRVTGIDYVDNARFMAGKNEASANVIAYTDRSDVYHKGYKYIKISPCDHSHRDELGLCLDCGDQMPYLAGYTVSLDGDIGVNYHMQLPASVIANPNSAYVEFTVGDKSPQKVYVKDATTKTVGGKTHYVFKCNVAAKEMTTVINARLVNGNDVVVLDPFTVKSYADYLLTEANHHPDYAKAKDLVVAMLNYGAYAQAYFGVNKDNPANEGCEYNEDKINDVSIPTIYSACSDNLRDGTVLAGISLSLKSETALTLYFTSDKDLTFSCADKTKTIETGTSGSYKFVRIGGIKASQLGNTIEVFISIGGIDGYDVKCSPLLYCYLVLNGGYDDVKLQNVCKALYLYYKAADAYSSSNA